jgi:hypothetical protein
MYTCHTGGAVGADIEFECESLVNGFKVKAYLPIGFDCKLTHPTLCAEFVDTENKECCDALLRVCQKLNEMSHPHKPWLQSIVRRNYYQIKDSDAVFAIAPLIKQRKTGKLYKVKGGTRYAVFMGIEKGIPVYVYHKKQWHKWDMDQFKPITMFTVPKSFTGIGMRKIDNDGILAIRSLIKLICPKRKLNQDCKIINKKQKLK